MANTIKKYQTCFISKTNDMKRKLIILARLLVMLWVCVAAVIYAFKTASDWNDRQIDQRSKSGYSSVGYPRNY